MRRHHSLRARNARCYRDHIWPRGSGRHDQLAPARRLHVDRGRLGDLRGHCVTGLTGAYSAFAGAARATAFRCWLGLCLRLGRRDDLEGTPPERRGRRRRSRGTRTGSRRLDRCLLRWPRDRLDRGLRGCDGCRNEHDAQLRHLDASLLPGEAQARKPKSLASEGQAQQPSVNQQREQQRRSHSPSLRAHALDQRLPARCGLRRLLSCRIRWRCQRGVGTFARRRTLPSPLRPLCPTRPQALALPLRRRS